MSGWNDALLTSPAMGFGLEILVILFMPFFYVFYFLLTGRTGLSGCD